MPTEPKDLLIADLEHFGEARWRNEEVGEKRLNVFITLVTAVSGGLVALATTDHAPDEATMRRLVVVATAVVWILGLVTWLRLLKRNAVTDQYQATLTLIRQRYAALCEPLLDDYRVPVKRDLPFLSAGYAETVAVIEGLLLMALLVAGARAPALAAVAAGVALATVLWGIAKSLRHKATHAA